MHACLTSVFFLQNFPCQYLSLAHCREHSFLLCTYWAFSLSALYLCGFPEWGCLSPICVWVVVNCFGLSAFLWGRILGVPPVSAFLVCSQDLCCADTRPVSAASSANMGVLSFHHDPLLEELSCFFYNGLCFVMSVLHPRPPCSVLFC